ncbi:spectrin beta chain, non-erythrocytic 1-like, partial [Etheostoma cragini]|uniref:spectrin beta chain, non-erythrocytic 1-like n=1 Tax=Etheostoma cragini TaxID=417921 RepID=UPI00155E4307
MLWMEDVIRLIETQENPRDVSSVELLMNNHQGIKAEIDARNDSFTSCIELGKALLARKHYASPEIKEKLLQLTDKRKDMIDKWEDRWEWLRLSLPVYGGHPPLTGLPVYGGHPPLTGLPVYGGHPPLTGLPVYGGHPPLT